MGTRNRPIDTSERKLRLSLRHDMSHDLVPYAALGPAAEAKIGMMPIA